MAKTGIVLGGGGAKGAFSLGVLKQIIGDNVKPDVIYGSSVGALNAVCLSYLGIEGLEKFWREIRDRKDVMNFNFSSLFLRNSGVFNLDPLKAKIEAIIKNGKPTYHVYATVVSLNTGKIRYVHHTDENFVDFVVASCSIPGVFEPVNGYADGGIRENVPLKRAIKEDKVDNLHVILNNPIELSRDSNDRNWVQNSIRAFDVMYHDIIVNDLKLAEQRNTEDGRRKIKLFRYAPDTQPIDLFDFNKDKISKGIEKGMQVTRVVVG